MAYQAVLLRDIGVNRVVVTESPEEMERVVRSNYERLVIHEFSHDLQWNPQFGVDLIEENGDQDLFYIRFPNLGVDQYVRIFILRYSNLN